MNTTICSFISCSVWIAGSIIWRRKLFIPDILVGIVVGLVAITPAAGFVNVYASPIFGLISGLISYISTILMKEKFKVDGN